MGSLESSWALGGQAHAPSPIHPRVTSGSPRQMFKFLFTVLLANGHIHHCLWRRLPSAIYVSLPVLDANIQSVCLRNLMTSYDRVSAGTGVSMSALQHRRLSARSLALVLARFLPCSSTTSEILRQLASPLPSLVQLCRPLSAHLRNARRRLLPPSRRLHPRALLLHRHHSS
jgi:hypothetical protein